MNLQVVKSLIWRMKIDSLSAMLNEFEMHSVFCQGLNC